MAFSLSDTLAAAALPASFRNESHLRASEEGVVYLAPAIDANKCWPIRPTLRNELDTFSVHFYVFFGPNISVPPDRAAVFAINLMPVLDSGGVLNMELKFNTVSKRKRSSQGKAVKRTRKEPLWVRAAAGGARALIAVALLLESRLAVGIERPSFHFSEEMKP